MQGIRKIDWVAAWLERRFARRASEQLLELYRSVQSANPELTGSALYAAVAAQRLGSGSGPAALAVTRADTSFAQWPRERDVCFRDVVHLLVFEECTRTYENREGTRALIGRVVSRIVPAEL